MPLCAASMMLPRWDYNAFMVDERISETLDPASCRRLPACLSNRVNILRSCHDSLGWAATTSTPGQQCFRAVRPLADGYAHPEGLLAQCADGPLKLFGYDPDGRSLFGIFLEPLQALHCPRLSFYLLALRHQTAPAKRPRHKQALIPSAMNNRRKSYITCRR